MADWRGRVYTLPAYLTYQGTDLAKALIAFADGGQISENNIPYLKRFGANTWGLDKESLHDRIKWVDENHEALLNIDATLLKGAAEPFGFLAFMLEYKKYINGGEQKILVNITNTLKNPERKKAGKIRNISVSFSGEIDQLCYLPIYLDATCNGLQHLAALG